MNVIQKTQWTNRAARRATKGTLEKPSTGHWNGPTVLVSGRTAWDHSKCASLLRGIQNFHMDEKNWVDIAYNFAVCPHRYIFELRGLNVINAANGTSIGNKSSHAILFIAGTDNPFTEEEKLAFAECVKHIADQTAAPNEAIGHRDHKSTECPGNDRYNWISAGMPLSGNVPPIQKDEFIMDAEAKRYFDRVIASLTRVENQHIPQLGGRLREFGDENYGQDGPRRDLVHWLGELVTLSRQQSVDKIVAGVVAGLIEANFEPDDINVSLITEAVEEGVKNALREGVG